MPWDEVAELDQSFGLHESLPSDSPYGYPTLRPELSLRHIVANGFAIGMIQADQEALDFAEWLRDEARPENLCELGTLCGGMFYVMDRVCQPGLRISIDMPWSKRDPTPCWPPHLFHQAVPNIQEIVGNIHGSETVGALLRLLDGRKIDLLFVDGDHSYEGGRLQFDNYRPMVREGGYVAFHDVRNGWPVGRFYDELCEKFWHREFVGPEGAIFGIGVLRV